jgi:hypothetical protein
MMSLDFVSEPPELANVVCLQKPFRPHELVRAIEAARQSFLRPVAGADATG